MWAKAHVPFFYLIHFNIVLLNAIQSDIIYTKEVILCQKHQMFI